MPRIEVKSIQAGNYAYYHNALAYVARKDKCACKCIGATNLMLPNKRKELEPYIESQVREAREFFKQEDRRLGIRFVINFSESELKYLNERQILGIGYHVAITEFAGCMTYFAVHDHSDSLHLDMLIFPLDITNGRMYGCNRAGWSAIEARLMKYLENFMPVEAVGLFQTAFAKNKSQYRYSW